MININSINNFKKNNRKLQRFLRILKKKIKNKKIAVVGSSKILLKSKLGKEIDSYNLIARFNLAPTFKYATDVGGRTDIIVTNNLYFIGQRFNKFHDNIRNVRKKLIIIIIEHPDPNYKNYLENNKYKFCHKSNDVIFFDNRLNSMLRFKMISKYNFFKKLYYYKFVQKFTGGLVFTSLVYLLNNRFKNFGFDLNKKQTYVDYYYKKSGYDKKKLNAMHDFELENKVLKKIIDSKTN